MNTQIQRREFLQKAALFAVGFFAFSETALAEVPGKNLKENQIPLLNPAFRMNSPNNGDLELYTFLADKSRMSYTFSGLDADILTEIANQVNPLTKIENLAEKHYLTGKECKRMITKSMKDFEKSGIIYYGELMLVKISEKQVP
jgi:hypothetical protein